MFRMSFKNSTFTYETRIAPDPFWAGLQPCARSRSVCFISMSPVAENSTEPSSASSSRRRLTGPLLQRHFHHSRWQARSRAELTKLQIVEVTERIKQISKKVERLQADKAKIVADTSEVRSEAHSQDRTLHSWQEAQVRISGSAAGAHGGRAKGSRADAVLRIKKLFRNQFALKENGYKDHAEWLTDGGERAVASSSSQALMTNPPAIRPARRSWRLTAR